MENVFKRIIEGSLCLLVFLLPLFFLPATILPVIISKQVLLALFVFLLLILWMVKVMVEGRLTLAVGWLPAAIVFLLLVLAISAAFSGSWPQSFWGMTFEPDTLFSFILYGLVFFLLANLVGQNQVKLVLVSFLASAGVLSTLFLVQALGKPIFPWGFAQAPGFNPIGLVQSFGIFLGGAFAILLALAGLGKRMGAKIILGILLFIPIFLINQWASWLGMSLAAIAVLGVMTKSLGTESFQQDFRKLTLPLFVLVLALIFIVIKMPTGQLLTLPVEISPTHRASLDIATKTLQESPKNLILGSGPASFSYQYGLYRGIGPNLTNFWQARFDQGASAALTFLTNAGILGIFAVFLIIATFLFQAFKVIYKNQAVGDENAVAVFIGGFYYLIAWFLYPSNLSLAFALFLMLGLWAALAAKKKEFSFSQSPQKAFLIMLSGTILIVVSIVGIYSVSRKYLAAINFTQGLNLVNAKEPKLDEGIKMIDKAIQLDARDVYLRNLSQAILFKINAVLNDQGLPLEQKQSLFQTLVSGAQSSADNAALLNPRNSQNWAQLGNIYENLVLFNAQGAGDLAISSYQKAVELDPQDPQLYLSFGEAYKTIAETAKLQISILQAAEKPDKEAIKKLEEASEKNLDLARQSVQKSIELKNDFQPALDFKKEMEELK